jgi:hypothetical protein
MVILWKRIFSHMSAWLLTVCRGPQDENQEKMAEWEYRSDFGRKNI